MKTGILKMALLAGCVGILVTGCGKSASESESAKGSSSKGVKLSCSMDLDDVSIEYNFTFNKDKTKVTGLELIMEEEAPEDFDWSEVDLDDACEDLGLTKSCKATRKGNTLRLVANLGVEELEDFTNGEVVENTSYDEVKDLMKEMELTCK